MTIRRSKIIGIVSIIFVAATMCGCNKIYYHYMRSYIQQYSERDEVSLKIIEYPEISIDIMGTDRRTVSFRSKGEDKEYFDMLCKKYGDTSYNREVGLILDMVHLDAWVLIPDICFIELTSDKDFDEDHPAGTLLNDCVEINFVSAYKYVKSKYSDEESLCQQKKLLSEIVPDDLKLMTTRTSLNFIKMPEIADIHILTVTMHDEYGNEYSDTIEFDFSKLTDTL